MTNALEEEPKFEGLPAFEPKKRGARSGVQRQRTKEKLTRRKQYRASFYGKEIFKPTLPDTISPFDRSLTHKSFFNIVYFSLISLKVVHRKKMRKVVTGTLKIYFFYFLFYSLICIYIHNNIFIYSQ